MLTWNSVQTLNTTVHITSAFEIAESKLRDAVEACTDKAISLLNNNIQNDSLYLLFEWNIELAKLTILVTDAAKSHDAPESVCCTFPNLALALTSQDQRTKHTEFIKFWLHDYLTTCTAFFSYSLVAIFHHSNRNNSELL